MRAALRAGLAYYGGVEVGGELVFRTRRPPVARLARTLFEDQRAAAPVRRGHDTRLYRATTFEIDLGPPPADAAAQAAPAGRAAGRAAGGLPVLRVAGGAPARLPPRVRR